MKWLFTHVLNDAVFLLSICEKETAIVKIGEALHALQDFYSHSNWVENHLVTPTVVPADIPMCPLLVVFGSDGLFAPGGLTADPTFTDTCTPAPGPPNPGGPIASGYYPDNARPPGKCTHGETNKDFDDPNVILRPKASSPRGAFVVNNRTLHEFAKDVAMRHTQAVWQDFKQAFILRFGSQGQDYYDSLVHKQINVAFTIDVSGSMDVELPTIKTKVAEWVNTVLANEIAPKLSLVTFENVIVSQQTTCSPAVFLSWVSALTAGGGFGCGEASITAALRAAELAGANGIVVLATDEPPNEGAAPKSALKRKPVKVYTIWERIDCPAAGAVAGEQMGEEGGVAALPSDVYAEIAAVTGGLSFPSLADVDLALKEILQATTPRLRDMLLVEGTVSSPAQDDISLAVDSTVERLDLILTSLGGPANTLEVLRPDGTPVSSSDPDATLVNTSSFQSVRVTAPAVGQWTMRIGGDGGYQASAMGVSDIALFDVSFLRIEDIGESLPVVSTVSGSLYIGETFDVEIDTLGETQSVSFDLVLPDGTVLEPLPASEGIPGLDSFAAQYTPDSIVDRFLVRATGTDTTGATFQRILRRSFSVSPIAVRPPEPQTTQPGCAVTYYFEVENSGPADTFEFAATSANGFDVSVSPGTVALATGQVTAVAVTVSITGGALNGEDELGLLVTSTTDPSVENMETVVTQVEDDIDCNCNGRPDSSDLSDGTSSDCNMNQVPDECPIDFTLTPAELGEYYFGLSVSISEDRLVGGAPKGNCADGSPYCGSAYVYRLDSGSWVEEQNLTASDGYELDSFGYAVSISGERIVISAPNANYNAGAAYVYRLDGASWIEEQKLTDWDKGGGDFGNSVSISGDRVVVGQDLDSCTHASPDCGSAFVYRYDGASWVEEQKLTASDSAIGDHFGRSVSISGDRLVVGAPLDDCPSGSADCGSAYVYRYDGASWVEEQTLTAPDSAVGDYFGHSVSISGAYLVVGAYADDCPDGSEDCGAAYVYRFDGAIWVFERKLTASNYTVDDSVGFSVSNSADRFVIGRFSFHCPTEQLECHSVYVFECDARDHNANGIPDECEVLALLACPNDFELATNGAGGERLSRFGCVAAPEPPAVAGIVGTAIRVVFKTLYNTTGGDPDGASVCVDRALLTTPKPSLSQFEGQTRWLGAPVEIVDEASPTPPSYIGAPLVCTAAEAAVHDWSPAGLAAEFGGDADASRIYFFDSAVVPCSVYEVSHCSDPLDETTCSDPVLIFTSRMADAWPPFDAAGQPSFTDINTHVSKYKGTPFTPGDPPLGGAPEWHTLEKGNVVADYDLSVANKKVGFVDIGVAVDGYNGIPYREPGPCDPDTATDNCGNVCIP
jgi:hypothetical protein